jgi:hypothetical protein
VEHIILIVILFYFSNKSSVYLYFNKKLKKEKIQDFIDFVSKSAKKYNTKKYLSNSLPYLPPEQ